MIYEKNHFLILNYRKIIIKDERQKGVFVLIKIRVRTKEDKIENNIDKNLNISLFIIPICLSNLLLITNLFAKHIKKSVIINY